jgi:hypothetical protein
MLSHSHTQIQADLLKDGQECVAEQIVVQLIDTPNYIAERKRRDSAARSQDGLSPRDDFPNP